MGICGYVVAFERLDALIDWTDSLLP